jgi:hypothetical protein
VVAHSPPNYLAAGLQSGQTGTTIITGAFIDTSFSSKVVGVMQIVYSYGGAMMFVNFMAEMKRPFDFIKGMAVAQTVIFVW